MDIASQRRLCHEASWVWLLARHPVDIQSPEPGIDNRAIALHPIQRRRTRRFSIDIHAVIHLRHRIHAEVNPAEYSNL